MDIETSTIDVGCIRPTWLAERAHVDIIVPPEARISGSITVLHPRGKLDGTGYLDLLDACQCEICEGACRFLIDLSEVEMVSSVGLLSIFMAGCLMTGRQFDDLDAHALMGELRNAIDDGATCDQLWLAAPNEKVLRALQTIGFDAIVNIFPTVEDAIDAAP
jgi:anti-anti-sigma regulatory factor